MARVTEQTVDHLARLARLSLTDDERQRFSGQLESILEYAEQLAGIDVEGVPPMTHAGVRDALRPDEPRPSLTSPLDGAPDAAAGFFRVPRVLG